MASRKLWPGFCGLASILFWLVGVVRLGQPGHAMRFMFADNFSCTHQASPNLWGGHECPRRLLQTCGSHQSLHRDPHSTPTKWPTSKSTTRCKHIFPEDRPRSRFHAEFMLSSPSKRPFITFDESSWRTSGGFWIFGTDTTGLDLHWTRSSMLLEVVWPSSGLFKPCKVHDSSSWLCCASNSLVPKGWRQHLRRPKHHTELYTFLLKIIFAYLGNSCRACQQYLRTPTNI